MFVSKNDIKAVTLDPVSDVTGTRQIHFVLQEKVSNQVTLSFFKNSQFEICTEEPFRKQVYPLNVHSITHPSDYEITKGSESQNKLQQMQQPGVQIMDILAQKPLQSITISEFVAVVYDDQWWLGKVQEVSVENNDANVSFLHPAGPRTSFHWMFVGSNILTSWEF